MRELFDIDRAAAELARAAADPVGRARLLNRRDLPKRFYKTAEVADAEDGFAVLLDGRPVRTPAKAAFRLPRRDLAATAAAEWAAQGDHIDPATMPLTRLANTVIDGVVARRIDVAADALKYAESDLVCYRAEMPERLVARQAAAWDPLLDWAEERFGARFLVADGVRFVQQDGDAIAPIRGFVFGLDPWRLAGLHQMTTIGGSLVAALAVVAGRLDVEAAFAAVTVDECWNLEIWGGDAEAEAKLAERRADFAIAARVAVP